MRWRSIVIAVMLIGLAPATPFTQTTGTPRPGLPPRDTTVTKPASGKITGRVISAETSAPLRLAQILLASGQLGVRRFATTNADGRFEFVEVAEGRYNLTASKGGYVTLQYGQRRAFEPGQQVAVADGQTVSRIDFGLPRGSVIAGRVTDEFGEPIAGAFLEVQRYQYGPSGQRRLMFAGGPGLITTNDLGEFRAYGLMPGSYVVSGMLRQPMFQQGSNPNDASEGYAPTFYPGTPNPAEAELITVDLAQEVSIQLTLRASRMARISGVVTTSEGKPVPAVGVSVRNLAGAMRTGGSTRPDGTFTVVNVPPGEHYLDVVAQPRSDSVESASVLVTVAEEDLTNLRIVTGPAATVKGSVTFEGSSPRTGTLGGLRVVAQAVDPQNTGPFFGFDSRGQVGSDGAFELRAMGRVFFRPINLGPWMLKRVSLDGDDITDMPYELRNSQSIEGLRVVLTDRLTDLSGTVRDERGQPLKEFVVVVQPARERSQEALTRYLRAARPDQDGRFALQGIPPGEYVATVVEALEAGREWDPEYRPRLREAGRPFSIREGESLQLDLEMARGL